MSLAAERTTENIGSVLCNVVSCCATANSNSLKPACSWKTLS